VGRSREQVVTASDRATIDRLWDRFGAAWFEGGKDYPKLALTRIGMRKTLSSPCAAVVGSPRL